MPGKDSHWWHIILSTKGSWLHGDERGFRSRGHRIHSSGDYKHRPPENEHEGLREYHKDRSAPRIIIPKRLRSPIGEAILRKIHEQGFEVIIISVSGMHVHLIVKLFGGYKQVRRTAGTWKQASSHKVRDRIPGSIWGESGKPIRIANRGHQVEAFNYILEHAERGAWVWTFREPLPWELEED